MVNMPNFISLKCLFSLLVIAAVTFASPASIANDSNCRDFLGATGALNSPYLLDPFESEMISSKLFYSSGMSRDQKASVAFYASNEMDWFNTPWDDSPADVMVGFGTNSAWDLASRRNVKELYIGDWQLGPLVGQHYVLAPLLKLARTPVEFMFLLSGEAPEEAVIRKNLKDGMDDLGQALRKRSPADQYAITIRSTVDRLKNVGATENEILAVQSFLEQRHLPSVRSRYGIFHTQRAESLGNIFGLFAERYIPQVLYQNGADPDLILKGNFSFLSSQESFDAFKKLFVHVKLAHTDYMSEDFYRKVKASGDNKGYTKYNFSITNIIDSNDGHSKEASLRQIEAYRKMIYKIFPAPKYEVVINVTTNYRSPHGFLRIERNSPPPTPEQWILAIPSPDPRTLLNFLPIAN